MTVGTSSRCVAALFVTLGAFDMSHYVLEQQVSKTMFSGVGWFQLISALDRLGELQMWDAAKSAMPNVAFLHSVEMSFLLSHVATVGFGWFWMVPFSRYWLPVLSRKKLCPGSVAAPQRQFGTAVVSLLKVADWRQTSMLDTS